MLFSNAEIAQFINQNFEPSWESVRPVPKVTIDFGNGIVVNRTLHGNVATYICNERKIVQDVLPGVYSPTTYLEQLGRFVNSPVHHQSEPQQQIALGKTSFAMPLNQHADVRTLAATDRLFKNLQTDSRLNEKRQVQIAAYLKAHFKSTPASMKFWLYREVLHADLDDPYLGLHKVLFANYPFED